MLIMVILLKRLNADYCFLTFFIDQLYTHVLLFEALQDDFCLSKRYSYKRVLIQNLHVVDLPVGIMNLFLCSGNFK